MIRPIVYGLLGLFLFGSTTQARDRPFLDDPDDALNYDYVEKEWVEGEFTIPKGYQEQNLQAFQVDDQDSFTYYIDRASMSVSNDGISRFILVIRSASGVDNAAFEGMHCGKREYRVYAYGGQHGFTPMSDNEWQHINRTGSAGYRDYLYSNLICDTATGRAIPPRAVFDAMQRNTKTHTTPFLID